MMFGGLFMMIFGALVVILVFGGSAALIAGLIWVFIRNRNAATPAPVPFSPASAACSHCGAALQPGWSHCPQCGAAV